MNLRKDFEKLIEKKRAEIGEAQRAMIAAEAYIQALTDALKKLPKEDQAAPTVRPGSEVEKVRDAILAVGQPMHLNAIIEALGRSDDPDAKTKIAGLLGWYTSKGRVFTKTAPNTYGLVELAPPILPDEFGAEAAQ
jgi:hypothetical protein